MKESKILKTISYILIPILILFIITTFVFEASKESVKANNNDKEYFQSDNFLESYMSSLGNYADDLIYNNDNYNKIDDNGNKICYTEIYGGIKDFYFIIQYQNLAITNVELTENTKTIDGIKNYISSQEGYETSILNGNVESDSELIKNKALKYFYKFDMTYYTVLNIEENQITQDLTTNNEEIVDNVQEKIKEYHEININDFQIYSTYKEEMSVHKNDEIFQNFYTMLSKYENIIVVMMPISGILLALIFIYLIISIGHSKGKDEIDLNDLDKIPLEFVYLVSICIITIMLAILSNFTEFSGNYISLFIFSYFITYIFGITCIVTTIKRIKAKVFLKNTLTVKFLKLCNNIIKKIVRKLKGKYGSITKNWNKCLKLILIGFAYIMMSAFLIALFNIIGFCIAFGIGVYLLYEFNRCINCYIDIENYLKSMYEGDHTRKLDPKDFTKEFQDIVKYINDISSGFENAIQEGIKSERLKTELITNVSHDIKTPLTSIINYVDLLKKENIENEKAKEYVEILDNKSQRLKKLITDLVEASKASSGNVKLNFEKIDICELIKQAIGEFEDKFKDKKLEILYNSKEENIYINADNKYMYRIIENLFTNISKYTLEESRVYIDITKINSKAKISIKNISKERLNITADELMQRFVRGDKSRTTEGSGLGISISKSLTEIQNGEFTLCVDGDLFKVELEFEAI